MQPRHQVSSAAIALIKRFEGFRRSAAQLPDGRWTIGYGHTRSAREGARIEEEDASALLLYDLAEIGIELNEAIFTPLTQNQFDALVSFAMNIGADEFRRSSVLLRINEGSMLQAAAAIELWRRADFEGERIVVDALVRRRAAEKALFLTPTDDYVPTPTPVVRPRLDTLAGGAAITSAAVKLTAPLEGDTATVARDGGPDFAEAAPSPTETASASVSARLQAMLDDLDLGETTVLEIAPPAEPQAEPERAEPAPSTPRPIIFPLPDPSSHAQRAAEAALLEPEQDLDADVGPFGDALYDETQPFARTGVEAARIDRTPANTLPLASMLAVGVVLLAAATFWFVAAHPKMGGVAPAVIGWGLGLTGIVLLAGSIYFLLERIGGHDDED